MKQIGGSDLREVGKSIIGRESGAVLGRPIYTADLERKNILAVKVFRKPHRDFKVKSIDIEEAKKLEGIECILVPEEFKPLNSEDIAVIAGRDVAALEAAKALISVEYENLEHGETCGSHKSLELKDLTQSGEIVMSGTYRSSASNMGDFETPRAFAELDHNQRLVVLSATEDPSKVQIKLAEMLEFPIGKIRVKSPKISGGYGGKQDLKAEYYSSLMTLKTGKAAALKYSVSEMLAFGKQREALSVDVHLSVSEDGKLEHLGIKVDGESTACDYHEFDISELAELYDIKSCIGYKPSGLEFGINEIIFALESAVNDISAEINMDPLELRRLNLKSGNTELETCLEKGSELMDWRCRTSRKEVRPGVLRGLGMALAKQDTGLDLEDRASATIKLIEDGSFTLLIQTKYLGGGSETILAQICAEAIGVETENITVISSDTDLTPFGTGTFAGSTMYAAGNAVKAAAEQMRRKMIGRAAKYFETTPEQIEFNGAELISLDNSDKITLAQLGKHLVFTLDQLFVCESYAGEKKDSSHAAGFAEVEVDIFTGKIDVTRVAATFDLGTVLNPRIYRSQLEGALGRALGRTLYDRFSKDTRMDYRLPNLVDMPEILVEFAQSKDYSGLYGAKSYAMEVEAIPAAIREAIYNAVGIRVNDFPITPEKIYMEIKNSI